MRTTSNKIQAEAALRIFREAPDEALVSQEIVGAVIDTPVASLEKARCLGDERYPPFTRIGDRVKYKVGTVRKYLAELEERVLS